jgi:hypothetical protein
LDKLDAFISAKEGHMLNDESTMEIRKMQYRLKDYQ